jgi:hypothetical protein
MDGNAVYQTLVTRLSVHRSLVAWHENRSLELCCLQAHLLNENASHWANNAAVLVRFFVAEADLQNRTVQTD